jgi:CheY-like chemotaxis protein
MSRVLIVDDDVDHAESLADVIEMRGHSVEMANNGEDGIALFRSQPFDFVLMDVKLPGMNGVDTFLELKKIQPSAKVMMMTGFSVDQLVAQAIDGGALGVMHKPFPATHILEMLVREIKPSGRILVADDDPDFVESIVPILESGGYSVDVARTGAEALEKMMAEPVDCLLLDLRMPVMSGAELYARLMEAGRAVPTVLVSQGREETDDARLRSTCGLLFKPFDPNSLLTAISSAVSQTRTG